MTGSGGKRGRGAMVVPEEELGVRPGNNSYPFSSANIPRAQPPHCSLVVSSAPFYFKSTVGESTTR